jgi:hypothetical protein
MTAPTTNTPTGATTFWREREIQKGDLRGEEIERERDGVEESERMREREKGNRERRRTTGAWERALCSRRGVEGVQQTIEEGEGCRPRGRWEWND